MLKVKVPVLNPKRKMTKKRDPRRSDTSTNTENATPCEHALTHRGTGRDCEACLTGKTKEPQHRRVKPFASEETETHADPKKCNQQMQTDTETAHRWSFDTVGPTSRIGIGGHKFLSVGLHNDTGYVSVRPKKVNTAEVEAECLSDRFRGAERLPIPSVIRVDGGPEYQCTWLARTDVLLAARPHSIVTVGDQALRAFGRALHRRSGVGKRRSQ